MKKRILLLGALVLCGTTFAQMENYVSETGGENNPIVYVEQNYPENEPCGDNNPGNNFENGKSCTFNLERIVANDFIVEAGESLTLENMLVNVFIGATGSGVNAAFFDIYYYNDNNGEPGSVIGGEFEFFPTSQSVVGTNFGFDVWQIELDVPNHTFYANGNSPRRYWIGLSIEATDGSNLFWENSTLGIVGSGEAYDDGMGSGTFVVDPTLDGVFFLTADCVPELSVDDNFANQLQLYPNPVTDGILTINSPLPGTLQVAVYDIIGKKVVSTALLGNQLDVSALQAGVYMLRLTQNNQTATKKLVVR